jgi:seryl-tRNA(Sec) selenium transferase
MPRSVPNDPAALETALAERLEAEGALLAASLAAATVWALAGLLGRGATGRDVLLPLAHLGRIEGAPLAELIRLAGAEPRAVGTVRDCPEAELARALADRPAAALLLVDPELPEVVPPARFLWLAREAAVPSLLLDAASGRWTAWLDGGASLVLLEAEALAGVEGGILVGDATAIAACRAAEAASAACRAPTALRTALAAALAAREEREGRGAQERTGGDGGERGGPAGARAGAQKVEQEARGQGGEHRADRAE